MDKIIESEELESKAVYGFYKARSKNEEVQLID